MAMLRLLAVLTSVTCLVGCDTSLQSPNRSPADGLPPSQDLPPPDERPADPMNPGALTDGTRQPFALRGNAGMVLSLVTPQATPWHASIDALDLASRALKPLLTGESGDPAFFYSGGELLLFNRSADSQNYRRLLPAAGPFAVSKQGRFPGGDIGDPHDALYLGHDRVLLAHYAQGTLVVMQQSTGKQLGAVQADWDLPDGVTLKPEALLAVAASGKRYVYVVHQALTVKDGLLAANGSQAVFVLEDTGDDLKPLNLDPSQPKIRGIKLKGSFPTPVRFQQRARLLLVSLCSRLVLAATSDPAQKCTNAVEEVDPITKTASEAWDLESAGLSLNGLVAPGPDADTFFASVVQQQGSGPLAKRVVKLSLKDRSITPVYEFQPDTAVFWALLYDEASKTLLIGDRGDQSAGKIVIMPSNGQTAEVPLTAVPYSAAFIPSPQP